MKTKLTALLFGISLSVFSHTFAPIKDSVLITGKVDIRWSKKITLKTGAISLIDPWINRKGIDDSIIPLNPDGSFRIQLPLESADFYSLSHESNEVQFFLAPQDSLNIDFKGDKIFSGKGAEQNNHLQAMRAMINSNRKYINGTNLFTKSSDALNNVLDSLLAVYKSTHQQFAKDHPIHPDFEQKILADIHYRNKLYQVVHPALHKQQTGKRLPVSETYFEDIAVGGFDNPNMLKSLDYILFLNDYLNAQSAGSHKFDVYFEAPIDKIHPKYEQIQLLNAHQDIKDYLFHDHLNKSMDSYGVAYLKDIMPKFREDCKNPKMLEQIEARFQKGMEQRQEPDTIRVYKQIGNIALEAHIFYPEDFRQGQQRAAYLFFHGGGWSIGIPEWGYKACKKYSSKGMVAISFEYRLIDIHKSNLLDCVRDAKSAILWARKEAESLGIHPDKIVASGFSAGGHLAVCTAILNEYEEKDPTGLGSKPNAIVVQSASYNTLKNPWFSRNSEQKAESISTYHQLDRDLVPGIFFHGTDDHLAPIKEFTDFRDKMNELGNDYEYRIFENVGHFFNNNEAKKTVGELTDAFLTKLGYLNP